MFIIALAETEEYIVVTSLSHENLSEMDKISKQNQPILAIHVEDSNDVLRIVQSEKSCENGWSYMRDTL